MLSKGTKDLDQILSFRQPLNANWGLGYNGKEFVSTVFVHGNESSKEQVTVTEHGECSGPKKSKSETSDNRTSEHNSHDTRD